MSVFRRMRDITVANLNEHLEQSQDPVKLIDQFLVSTRQEIGEAEKLRHQYASHTRQMKQQADQARYGEQTGRTGFHGTESRRRTSR